MGLRGCFFRGLDWFRHSPVTNHLHDIKDILENSDPRAQKPAKYLNDLLEHATSTVPFYKKFDGNAFGRFPVIQKTLVQDNFQSFISEQFTKSKRYEVYTSGSTGLPFRLFHDQNKKYRRSAEAIYFLSKTGYKIGDPLYYFRLWKGDAKSGLSAFSQNIIKVDVSRLSDAIFESLLREWGQKKSRVYIFGLASGIGELCRFMHEKGIKKFPESVKGVVANSEMLPLESKNILRDGIKGPVVSRYSNEEQGIIAQQPPDGKNYFEINWASYHVEIFEFNKDVPAALGTLGRIVVTDLFNYYMPLIRYDTGDLGVMEIVSGQLVLTKVEGRKMDAIFNTNGELISSYCVYVPLMKYFDFIKQYQFIQVGKKEYLLKLNTLTPIPDEHSLIEDFKEFLGSDAYIQIEYVDEIPILSSGKRKRVANLFRPN